MIQKKQEQNPPMEKFKQFKLKAFGRSHFDQKHSKMWLVDFMIITIVIKMSIRIREFGQVLSWLCQIELRILVN